MSQMLDGEEGGGGKNINWIWHQEYNTEKKGLDNTIVAFRVLFTKIKQLTSDL